MIRYILSLVCLVTAGAVSAQDRIPSHCRAFAQAPGIDYLHRASFRDPVAQDTVRITYVDHAMFLIQSERLSAMTDFTGWYGNVDFTPDVVTMNNAHSTHFTSAPDPAIPHVLEGWELNGQPRDHELDLGEMLIRNVSTDIRSRFGGTEDNGNSIFIFEVEGLCIGHLGHLHHEPNDQQYAAIGRLDVVMAPVDGGYTLPREVMVRIVDRLRSSIVIPMHWFSGYALEAFLEEVQDSFVIDRRDSSFIELSLRDLPPRPTVVVLRPEWLRDAPD